MNKKQIQQRVLQHGKPLELDKFEWDEKTNTFSSSENSLVLDFSDVDYCTFKTGSYCTFTTGDYCVFDTGSDCTFKTGSDCTFNTGDYCVFDTGSDCTFKTGFNCVVVRRDVYEIIELEEGKEIKLNGYGTKGYTEVNSKKSELLKKADELISKAQELKDEANKLS